MGRGVHRRPASPRLGDVRPDAPSAGGEAARSDLRVLGISPAIFCRGPLLPTQRWNRYVSWAGYDLHQQIRLFEDFNAKYERLPDPDRNGQGLPRQVDPPLGSSATGLLASLLALAYAVWKRRRVGAQDGPHKGDAAPDPNTETATMLYRGLEGALAQGSGIVRPPSLPPLRHAEDLRARRHPVGEEVLALTEVYIAARFGGVRLDEGARRDFERRIKTIRAWRRQAATIAEPAEA